METRLSQAQLDEFGEQGFLVLPAVFDDDEVADACRSDTS